MKNGRMRNYLLLTFLVLLVGVMIVPSVRAFEGRGGDVVVIEADEVIEDDLYVGAGEFRLEGVVEGDLVAFGGTITINGTIGGDLIAAGQSVVINGVVEDDARIAGYALAVTGEVADDLIAAGFSLEHKSASTVGGDLLYAGYQSLLDGEVSGNAKIGGGAVRLSGSIGGDVTIDVGGTEPGEVMPPGFPFAPTLPTVPSIPGGLTIEDSASIGGDLDYTANARIDLPDGVVGGQTDFTQYVPEDKQEAKAPSAAFLVGRWFLRQFRHLITFLLIGALMMWLVPDWTRKIASTVEKEPLPSLGWGAVSIVAFSALMGLLVTATIMLAVIFGVVTLGELAGRFAVLGGIITSSVGFSFSILWRYVTAVAISLLVGQLILRLFKSPAEDHRWWPMLLGVAIFVGITAVPVLGWLVKLVAVLLGLGAIWLWGREWWKDLRAEDKVEANNVDQASIPDDQ